MKLPADPDFRPNPKRAVFLSGPIDQTALDKLFPDIFGVEGSQPITLYLDSPGGRPHLATRLQRMLVAPSQDTIDPRRLITVATGFVASAAADLLVAGDYTIAYEHAVIMMHGVRQASDTDITTEHAADLARTLASSNEQSALTLASNCVSTFFFRVAGAFDSFGNIRGTRENSQLRDVDCFILATEPRVSADLADLLRRAATQCIEMDALAESVRSSLSTLLGKQQQARPAEIEAEIFRAILNHELTSHPDPAWTFGERGFDTLQQKTQLLIAQTAERHSAQVATLRERWGYLFVTAEEFVEMRNSPREEWKDIVTKHCEPRIRQFWFLLVAICRGLQTADFYLSAEEAYWLGFVDEVIGRLDLPTPRIFAEYTPGDAPEQES